MESNLENKDTVGTESIANEEVSPAAEDAGTGLPTKPLNADEENDVSPPATSCKVPKKKSKPKARNSGGSNDLDIELKKLTQRRINVAGAPKMPLNSYVRFMNDRREQLRREYPNRTALEHTKMIGEEWHQLSEDRRAPYMEAAAKDRALYQEQMHKFLKEHPEIVANELAKAKKVFESKNASTPKAAQNNSINNNSSSSLNESISSINTNAAQKKANAKAPISKQQPASAVPATSTPDPDDIPLSQVKRTPTPPPAAFSSSAIPAARPFAAGEIPIYTNEFIEHNRSTENELRTLRKNKTDLEQQNAVLEQHVDNTKAGHAKVMGEVAELKEENVRLNAYLKGLRQKLVAALGGLPLPALEPSGLNVDNVDKYMQHLASMINSSTVNGQHNNAMLLKVGEILGKLETSGLQKS